MNSPASPVDHALLNRTMEAVFAPWVKDLHLRVTAARPGEVQLALPVTAQHVHGGGVLCGQTLMAACDSAMVLAVVSQLGEFKPMTTVQLQTSFLRAVAGDSGQATVVDNHTTSATHDPSVYWLSFCCGFSLIVVASHGFSSSIGSSWLPIYL